jgi:hypothetical protein
VQSGQGLEKTWAHLSKAKNYYQSMNGCNDLVAIFGALSEREDQHSHDTFATEPTKSKKDYAILSNHYNTKAGIDVKSSAYYTLKDGRALTRSEAIGNAKSIGGYRADLPNDAFSKEWKDEAVNQALGTDKNDGLTIREIQMQQDATKETSCVSSKQAAVKVSFAKIVGSHLTNNTPAPLDGESSHSFLRRRAQRYMSTYPKSDGNHKNPPKKQKAGKLTVDAHERELEDKKWNKDVEKETIADL